MGAMLAALVCDVMRPGMIMLSVVVIFLCAGIITPKEMLEGFSNAVSRQRGHTPQRRTQHND